MKTNKLHLTSVIELEEIVSRGGAGGARSFIFLCRPGRCGSHRFRPSVVARSAFRLNSRLRAAAPRRDFTRTSTHL